MPARQWVVLEHFMDPFTYITDAHWDVYNLSAFGVGATVERWILDWYAVSEITAETNYDSQWQYSKIVVFFQDGGSESEPPLIYNANLDWVFNDMFLWQPSPVPAGDGLTSRWHASSSGYLRSSQGQRKQTADTGGLVWVGYGQYSSSEAGRNNLPFRLTYSLRALIQPAA